MELELILSGALALGVGGLELLSRRLKRDPDSLVGLVVIAFCLGMLIWVPPFARSIVVGGAVILLGFGLGGGFAVFMILCVVAATVWLPGGISVLLLCCILLGGMFEIRKTRQHLIRLSRAPTLIANEPTPHEVELTGTIRAVTPTVDPVHGKPCAMWKISGVKSGARESESVVELTGETGSAIIDLTAVRMEWTQRPTVVSGDDARRVADELGLELDSDGSFLLYVLLEGTACYVVGKPTWEIAPPNTVGMYRDAPVLPTFRSTLDTPVWFADRSEALLRADHVWALTSWIVWSVMCAAIAVSQFAGWT